MEHITGRIRYRDNPYIFEKIQMRIAQPIILTREIHMQLLKLSTNKLHEARIVERARIILLAAKGFQNITIADKLEIDRRSVARWRERFLAQGIAGILRDVPHPRRVSRITKSMIRKIVATSCEYRPANATHWSTRTMAAHYNVSHSTIMRIWHAHGIKPHLVRSFKLSRDPHFAEKLEDIVGLYMNPPDHAIVLSVDEKSQIQALDRTQPGLPMKKGRAQTMTHDYARHGTTTLFTALNTLNGTVIGECMPKHRHQEYLRFLQRIDREIPRDRDIHLIVDNYATHKHPRVMQWLKRHPRIHVHFTPTSASWLNMVERFFREITEKAIRRGAFGSVDELIKEIKRFIAVYNQNPKPFVWTKSAKDILAKVLRANDEHYKYYSA